MTMRRNIFLLILAISGMALFFTPSLAAAQGQNIAEVLKEKETQGSGMKGRSFKKPKPAEAPVTKPAAEAGAEAAEKTAKGMEYSEIVEDTGAESESEQRPPEEDVWEKYKSIAAGSESKTLTRKSYSVGKEETTHTKKIRKPKDTEESGEDLSEESDDSEDKDQEKEAKASKKKKGGMAGILEDYKNKQTNKKPIRGHTLNQ
jgi:hypothetical protein